MTEDKSTISGARAVTLTPDTAGERLDRALAAAMPELSRERLKNLLRAGAVSHDGHIISSPAAKAVPGATYYVHIPDAAPAAAQPQDIPLSVVHEDDDIIVVDKPAGLVVHPAAGNADGTLVNALLHHCAGALSGIGGVARPGIVHRIDKGTSGLLVVAKTDAAHQGLAAQFAAHSIGRLYIAIVAGRPVPPAGRIEGAIGRSSRNRKKMDIVKAGRGKPAVTHYETRKQLDDAAMVACRLETGRTHQVRVHMREIGHALLGDPLYGSARGMHRKILNELAFKRQALHACELQFIHPRRKEKLAFQSPLPTDIKELITALER